MQDRLLAGKFCPFLVLKLEVPQSLLCSTVGVSFNTENLVLNPSSETKGDFQCTFCCHLFSFCLSLARRHRFRFCPEPIPTKQSHVQPLS